MLGEEDVPRSERFEVKRCLGAGGMGVVYEAIDRVHNARVALKTLHTTNPDSLRRLKREFRELQDIHHPNLVRLGELIEERGQWFVTMELVDGVTFLEHVRPPDGVQAPLDTARLRSALGELAQGLKALHESGRIHRDIKPSNVLVTSAGRVVLLDFGLITSCHEPASWSQPQVVGTAAYMAPEQAIGSRVGPEADWYSVGVMLYEALAARLPFDGTALQVLMAKQDQTPAAPQAVRAGSTSVADLEALCAQLLHKEPDDRPTAADVLARLAGAPAPRRIQRSQSAPPFVGRVDELGALRAAAETAAAGQLACVLVEGESGIGKTSLARRFADELAERDVIVLRGRCYERESLPYRAVDGIMDELARFLQARASVAAAVVPRRASLLTQVFPVLRVIDAFAEAPIVAVADPQELRSRLFGAVRELFARLVERARVAFVIDDLQWADADSLALLSELTAPTEPPALLLIGTWRPIAAPQPASSRIDRMPFEWQRVKLGPLASAHACELAKMLLERANGQNTVRDASQLATEAGGHPLFIDALVRHAASTALAEPAPARLEEALMQRVERLDADTRRVLELIAIAGTPVDLESLSVAVGRTLNEVCHSADVLRLQHFASGAGRRASDRIESYHDRVRQAVLDGIATGDRVGLHRDLSRGLETTGRGEAEMLASHHRAAGDLRRAGVHAARAAEEASRVLAFDRAAAFYAMALELLGPDHPDRVPLLIALAEEREKAGRGREAAEAFLEAAPHVDELRGLELRRRACEQLMVTGHIDESLAELQVVLGAFGMSYPKTHRRALLDVIGRRARLAVKSWRRRPRSADEVAPRDRARIELCLHAAVGLGTVDNIRGHAFHMSGVLLALDHGDANQLSRALALEGAFRACMGKRAARQADAVLDYAYQLAIEANVPYAKYEVVACKSLRAFVTGRFTEALAGYREAARIIREQCVGMFAWQKAISDHWLAILLFYCGRLRELASVLPPLLREAEDRGNLYGITTLTVATLPFVWLTQDQPHRALSDIDTGMARWTSRGVHLQHYYELVSRASALLYLGDARAALQFIDERTELLRRAFVLRIQIIEGTVAELRARAILAAATRDHVAHDAAAREVTRSLRVLDRIGEPWSDAFALNLRAGLAALARDPGAAAMFEAAGTAFAATGMQLHATAARSCGQGDGGRAARSALADEGVVDVERMIRHLVPIAPG